MERGSGPLHAIIRVDGEYRYSKPGHAPAPFVTRIHAYAGRTYITVDHTFVFTGDPDKHKKAEGEHEHIATQTEKIIPEIAGDPGWMQPNDRLSAAGLAVELKSAPGVKLRATSAMGAGRWWEDKDAAPIDTAVEKSWALLQTGPKPNRIPPVPESSSTARLEQGFEAALTVDGRQVANGERAPGWMVVGDGTREIAIAMPRFLEEYPKEIRYEAGRATAFFWSPAVEPMSFARFSSDLDREEETVAIENNAQGIAKTSEVIFDFRRTGSADRPLNAFLHPPVVHAEPSWYGQSGVFGKFAARSERYPEFQRALDYKFEWMLFNQRWARGSACGTTATGSCISTARVDPVGQQRARRRLHQLGAVHAHRRSARLRRGAREQPAFDGRRQRALARRSGVDGRHQRRARLPELPEGAEGHDEAGDWIASRQSALGAHADRARLGAGLDGRLPAHRRSSRARRREADRRHAPQAPVGRARLDRTPPLSRALERDRSVGRDQGRALLEGNRRPRRARAAPCGERSGRQPRARSLRLRRRVCVALVVEVLPGDRRPPRRRGAGASCAAGARRAAAQSRDGVVSVERVFARARLRADRRAQPARGDPSASRSVEDRQAGEAVRRVVDARVTRRGAGSGQPPAEAVLVALPIESHLEHLERLPRLRLDPRLHAPLRARSARSGRAEG